MNRSNRRALLVSVLCVAGTLAVSGVSCTKKPSAIVVAIDSEGKVPKDIDSINIQVTRGASVPFFQTYAVTANGDARLPGTITLENDPSQDSTDPMTVLITGSLATDQTRVLRSATLGFQKEETKLLRMPLRYACYDHADCGDGSTCKAGQCVSDAVDVTTLPTFEAALVDTSSASGACFDQDACFSGPSTTLLSPSQLATFQSSCVVSAASLAISSGAAGALNLAFEWAVPTTTNADGTMGPLVSTGVFTVLDIDPDEGWSVQGGSGTLSSGICTALKSGQIAAVQVSTACQPKSSNQPLCVPPAGTTGAEKDAGSGGPDADTLDAGSTTHEAGGGSEGGTLNNGTLGSDGCLQCLEKADCLNLGLSLQDPGVVCALACPIQGMLCEDSPGFAQCFTQCMAKNQLSNPEISVLTACLQLAPSSKACAPECIPETAECGSTATPDAGGNGGAGGAPGGGPVPGFPAGTTTMNTQGNLQIDVTPDDQTMAILDTANSAQITYSMFGTMTPSSDGTSITATAIVVKTSGIWSQAWPTDAQATIGQTVKVWIDHSNPPDLGVDVTDPSAQSPPELMTFDKGSSGVGGGGGAAGAGGGTSTDPCTHLGFYDLPPECVGASSVGVQPCLGSAASIQQDLMQCEALPGCGTILLSVLEKCAPGDTSCINQTVTQSCSPSAPQAVPLVMNLVGGLTPACQTTCQELQMAPTKLPAACSQIMTPLTNQCTACLGTSLPPSVVSACTSAPGCGEQVAEYFWLAAACSDGDTLCEMTAEAYASNLCGSPAASAGTTELLSSPAALVPCVSACTPTVAPLRVSPSTSRARSLCHATKDDGATSSRYRPRCLREDTW